MAKPDICCSARLVNANSITICLFFLEKVPDISKPLPFAAVNQTYR